MDNDTTRAQDERDRASFLPGSIAYMVGFPEVRVDRNGNVPLYQQIYGLVKRGVTAGTWAPGDKLPSIRSLASELEVACNTVDCAYKQLVVEGYVKSKRGSGYIVQDLYTDKLDELPTPEPPVKGDVLRDPVQQTYTHDFRYGDLGSDTFPLDDWRRIANEVLSPGNLASLTSYHEKRGEYSLRAQIASILAATRGVVCEPEQVLITSGTQQSIALVCGLFDPHHDRIALDDPGYDGAHAIVRNTGFEVLPLRTDAGIKAYNASVVASKARLFYTTPSHQFPMGWCMDQSTRSKLISEAVANDAYILEDDYDSDYRYDADPIPSLQSMDKWGRVIYMGTFSKELSPALRLSFVVMPPALLRRFEQNYQGTRPTVSWVDQAMLSRFMEQGLWSKHARKMVKTYRQRYELLVETLEEAFDDRVTIHAGKAGMFVLLEVHNGMNQEALIAAAAKNDVRVYGTRRFWLDPINAPRGLVMLGFSAADEKTIAEGVPRLKQAWFPQG